MFCTKCGAEHTESVNFCPSCGAAAAPGEPLYNSQAGPEPQPQQSAQFQQGYQSQQSYYAPPPQPPAGKKYSEPVAVFCYLSILILIPLVLEPDSKFVRYHANQGLILLLASLLCSAVAIIPYLGWIAAAAGAIFCFVCFIIGLVNSLGGEMKPLPLIGKYELVKPLPEENDDN